MYVQGREQKMNKKLTVNTIQNIAEQLGWNVSYSEQKNNKDGMDKIASFYQYSPAGEDFGFDCFYKDADDLKTEIVKAYYDFDVDEHVEMWIEAKRNGVSGVPDVVTLVDDARAIQDMLDEFCGALLNYGRWKDGTCQK